VLLGESTDDLQNPYQLSMDLERHRLIREQHVGIVDPAALQSTFDLQMAFLLIENAAMGMRCYLTTEITGLHGFLRRSGGLMGWASSLLSQEL